MNTHRSKSARPFAARSKQGTSNATRPESRGHQNAKRSYERYLALAKAQAQAGDIVGAENYYQHAEHYFRLMSSDLETAPPVFGTRGADEKHGR
jgi:hypothetical protein